MKTSRYACRAWAAIVLLFVAMFAPRYHACGEAACMVARCCVENGLSPCARHHGGNHDASNPNGGTEWLVLQMQSPAKVRSWQYVPSAWGLSGACSFDFSVATFTLNSLRVVSMSGCGTCGFDRHSPRRGPPLPLS